MTIVDREVIGEGSSSEFTIPSKVSMGIFIENTIRKNIDLKGDSKWLTDVSTGKSMTYSQLLTSLRSVASALRKRGLKTGDSCVVIGTNFVELPLMSLAVWRAGGVLTFLAINLSRDAIETRMQEVGSTFVLTDYERAGRIVDVVKGLDFVNEVFVIGDEPVDGCTQFDKLLEDSGDECPENLDDVDLDSAAWLAYTSGTTGLAKCIVIPHRSVVGAFTVFRNNTSAISGYRYLYLFAMNNTGGFLLAMGSALAHSDIYCMSDFSEDKLLPAIDRVKPHIVSMYPAYVAWICRYPNLDRFDLSSVVMVNVVGSVVNEICEREIFHKLPNMFFFDNGYGMSEIGLVCRSGRQISHTETASMNKAKAIERHVFGSAGRVVPNCKIKIIDTNSGEKLGPNEVGEICVQSSSMMIKEYLNQPKETENFIRDGWAHTGDKGYYDDKENLFVLGRYKELIKYRCMHVVPTNVEKFMMTHLAIQDVAVVGLPHEVDGERPLAFVVLASGKNATADELIAYTNGKVMDEEKLRGGIRFIDKIPRNGLGKIVRPELMDLLHHDE